MDLMKRLAEMRKYPEVPQWWYGIVFFASLAIGIGCSVRAPRSCLCRIFAHIRGIVCSTGTSYAMVEYHFVYGD